MQLSSPSNGSSASYLLLAVLSAVLMGTIGVISKITGLSAETITFYRLGLGALLMLGYLVLIRRTSLLRVLPSWHIVLNGVFLAGFILFYVQAMNYTSMANAIMVVYLAPVVASLVAHFLLSEPLSRSAVLLIASALLGFAMMMQFKLEFGSGSADAIGLGYSLLALCAYAGFILVNRVMPHHIHVYSRTWYQLLIGACCMLPFMLMENDNIALGQWGWLLAAGLFPGFLAILFAVMALQHLPAAVFGTLAYFEPIAVVLFGWFIFSETLNLLQVSGCILIIASGVLQGWLSTKRQASRIEPEVPIH